MGARGWFGAAFLLAVCVRISTSRVLELDERFREARTSGLWLVMFYAPWCGHCKQLEPTWMEVGAAMYGESPVNVARLDCTRFSSIAELYGIRGFPTIKFITPDNQFEYRGPRTKESIIEFSQKAQSPPTSTLNGAAEIDQLREKHSVFFLYIGEEDTNLSDLYQKVASGLFLSLNFFTTVPSVMPSMTKLPTVLVFKDGTQFEIPLSRDTLTESQIYSWVLSEQLPGFNELSGASYHSLKSAGKSFAIAVLPEDNFQSIYATMKEIAFARDPIFHAKFVFCWVKGNTIVNSMTYNTISVPNIVVFEPTTYEYNMMSAGEVPLPESKTKKSHISAFLTDVVDGKAISYGGSGFVQQVKRFFSDAIRMLISFFSDTPILASFVIGVPTFIITLVCYCICTLDDSESASYPTDSEEEEEEYGEYEQLPEYEGEITGNVRRRNYPDDDTMERPGVQEKEENLKDK